jgi:S-adenosylmethionine-diacylgycerolhomoserine-N-methlytransferase
MSGPMQANSSSHALTMDKVYGVQRHFYDVTRKYYLLGRDRLIRNLNAAPDHVLLEVGCGTGRNLAVVGQHYADTQLFGLDISSEMLKSAQGAMIKAGLQGRSKLARADATAFNAETLFGLHGFDRIMLSYTLSMIPDWRGAITASLDALAEQGELHIVDFGMQSRLPKWFGRGLRRWLSKFHVTPRDTLHNYCQQIAQERGLRYQFESLYRDYAWSVVMTR